MKIVFMGTPDFAVPSLDMLVRENYQVAAAVTQPDKPKGRGNRVAMPAVKEYALQAGIKVLQPEKVRNNGHFLDELREIRPDLIITAAYGKILPKDVLELPTHGCINVHGSLLPKYRGAAPIQWAIINGEKVTGITIMYMDQGVDTGDMLHKLEMELDEEITAGELYEKLSVLGAQALKETLDMLEAGTLQRTPQVESEASYIKTIGKELGAVDWSVSSRDVHNLVRGTNPWPGAYTFYKGDKMKIWRAVVADEEISGTPGRIYRVDRDGIAVFCGKGAVLIKEVQFSNCRKMSIGEYICGHRIETGEILVSGA